MAELPGWVGQITELIQKIARLTGNVEALNSEVSRISEKQDAAQDRIRELEAEIRVLRAEVKGEAQVAAVNAVIQAHEQMIGRIHKVERQINGEDTVNRLTRPGDGPTSTSAE